MAGRSRTLTLKTQVEVKGLDKLDNLGKKLQKVGAGLTAGVTLPLAALGVTAIQAASELEQAGGAIESVFGEASGAVEQFSKTAADSFGLSERQVKEFGALLGAQLQSFGFEAEEAAKMTVELQQRAADMAATFGGTVPDAVQAISSLMRGERNPIERYGVALKQADIEARILALGLDTSTTAAKKQAEAIAGLDLLYEQTAKTAGQFARESDTLAGQQARLAAKWEDAQATLGQKLLPAAIAVVEAVSGMVDAFSELSPETQDLIVKLGLVAAAAGPVLLVIGSILRTVRPLISLIGKIPPGGLLARLFPLGAVAMFAEPVDQALQDIRADIRDFLGLGDVEFESPDWMKADLNPFSEFFLEVPPALKQMTDAQWEAVEESGNAWAAHRNVISDAMYGPGGAVPTIAGATDEMAADMGELPGKMADELLANQQRLTDATSELVNFMEQALSPAQEMASLQGFLTSGELAAGLVSQNPLVRQKADELRQAAEDRIAELNGYQYGSGFASTFALGISENQWKAQSAAAGMAQAIGAIMPQSEPKDPNSPFRGITTWGGKMVTTITDGIYGSLGVAGNASKALAGALAPNLSTSSIGRIGVPGVNAAAPRGGDVHIHLTVMGDLRADERTLPGTLRRAAFASGMGS